MKKCSMLRRISEYLDNEVPDNERLIFEKHINDCEQCNAFIRDIVKIRTRIQQAADYEYEPFLTHRIMYVIEYRHREFLAWQRVEVSFKHTIFALAMIVLLTLALWLYQKPETEQSYTFSTITDSTASVLTLQPQEISKQDIAYAVFTKGE